MKYSKQSLNTGGKLFQDSKRYIFEEKMKTLSSIIATNNKYK